MKMKEKEKKRKAHTTNNTPKTQTTQNQKRGCGVREGLEGERGHNKQTNTRGEK